KNRGWGVRLDVELEMDYVAVLDQVVFAFHAVEAFFAGGGDRAALHQVVKCDGFGFDEAALEIGMNNPGGFRSGGPGADRPGTGFFVVEGEKGAQAQQMIGAANQSAHT